MAFNIFSLFGSIFVDSSEAEKSISKTEEKSNKLSESFMNGMSTIGTWAAGFATAAAGAAIAVGSAAISVSNDVDSAMNDFAASTGIATDELKEYEDAMLNIYNNNFGESFEDIANSMSQVKQIMGDLGAEELEAVTQNALMLRDTFDFDVTESVRAANSMMDQFGITSEEAYNLIAQGAQNGLNQNGDLMDVVNEYAVHFSQLGLSAEDMFNMLASGAESGTFSIDKLGDAMKEFGIRTKDGSKGTAEAFEYLGYDADELFKTFNEGGEDAAAMTQILIDELASMPDSVEKTTAGVALFGTMWEDLGTDGVAALANLEGGISNTKDALAEINEVKYDDIGSMIEGLKRNFETLLLPLGNALIPLITQVVELIQSNMPVIESVLASLTPIITELFETLVPPLMDLISQLLPPLMDLINAILPAVSSILSSLLPILISIVQAVLPTAVGILNVLLPPILQIVEMVLPLLLEILTPLLDLLPLMFVGLQPILDVLMAILEPLLQLIGFILPPLIEIFFAIYSVYLKAMIAAWELFANIVKTVIDVIVSAVKVGFAFVIENFQKVIDFLKDVFVKYWQSTFENAKKTFTNIFEGIINFVKNVFAGNWRAAFENLKSIVGSVFEGMIGAVKNPVNAIITVINGLVSGVTKGINAVIDALNKLEIDVPGWVTELTGVSSFGFNIPKLTAAKIPMLAEGGTAIEGGSAIVGEAGAELINLPQGARVTPLTNNGDPLGYKDMTKKLDVMIDLLAGILAKEGVVTIEEAHLANSVNRALGALL